jgi:glutathione reductase (NADPH)
LNFRRVRQDYVDGIAQSYQQRLSEAGIDIVHQSARLVAADRVALTDGSCLRAAHIVVATGARPRRLDVEGFDLGMVSDDMFALDTRPQRVAIVGGGYVGTEFGCLLSAFGSEIEMFTLGRLVQGFDAELACALQQQMQAQGIRVNLDSSVQAVPWLRGENWRIVCSATSPTRRWITTTSPAWYFPSHRSAWSA